MQEVLRQEHKYLISMREYKKYSHIFKQILKQDRHNQETGYKIRSLYFDTLEDNDFHEKEDGIEIRRKFRLRLYDASGDFAMLEMKQKQGANQLKRSLKLKREDAQLLCQGNYTPLLKYSEKFAAECYAILSMRGYRPKCIVEYIRQAFIADENNTRITFDYEVKATESNFDIFSESLLLYPVIGCDQIILEVKYNGFLLSYIKDCINACDKSMFSVGKYCLGRTISLDYLF